MWIKDLFHLDPKLGEHWPRYLLQSFYATLAIFGVILLLTLGNLIAVASIGASTFIVFTMPSSDPAQARHLIGGHSIGLLAGTLFSLIPHPTNLATAIVIALAVGCTVFLMVATDTEHPPAAGTALAVAIAGFSPGIVVSILTSILCLALLHTLLKPHLLDLV